VQDGGNDIVVMKPEQMHAAQVVAMLGAGATLSRRFLAWLAG
jgi:hypothetical protein